MSTLKLTQSEKYFIRINYWDGDVLDRGMPTCGMAHQQAREASINLKADVDVCKGATVIASYKGGST